jgi:hypothetical protein
MAGMLKPPGAWAWAWALADAAAAAMATTVKPHRAVALDFEVGRKNAIATSLWRAPPLLVQLPQLRRRRPGRPAQFLKKLRTVSDPAGLARP